MLIDTHSHLNFKDFDKDRDEVIKRSLEGDVWFINIGNDYQSSEQVVKIAEKYQQGIFAAIGLHPLDVNKEEFDAEKHRELAKSKKVVAIGEIGLDYLNLDKKDEAEIKNKQKEVLLKQLELAQELDLPVIFHCRKAHNELLKLLEKFQVPSSKLQGVIHCFTGDWKQAKEYLEMGFYLGFNGIIFKMDVSETIKKIPLDRILVETDCPFLTPPMARMKRNEPLNVEYVIQKIAETRNESFKKVAQASFENAQKLFLKNR